MGTEDSKSSIGLVERKPLEIPNWIRGIQGELLARTGDLRSDYSHVQDPLASVQVLVLHVFAASPAIASQLQIVVSARAVFRIRVSFSLTVWCVSQSWQEYGGLLQGSRNKKAIACMPKRHRKIVSLGSLRMW